MKKVFIASSNDLSEEREKLETLLNREGFEPILWEAQEQSITEETFQERLNEKHLRNSKIVIFMIKSKFGEYTEKEFEFAYSKLGQEIEKIYVYFFKEGLFEAEDKEAEKIKNFRNNLKNKKEKLYIPIKDFQELEVSILKEKKNWVSEESQTQTNLKKCQNSSKTHIQILLHINQLINEKKCCELNISIKYSILLSELNKLFHIEDINSSLRFLLTNDFIKVEDIFDNALEAIKHIVITSNGDKIIVDNFEFLDDN